MKIISSSLSNVPNSLLFEDFGAILIIPFMGFLSFSLSSFPLKSCLLSMTNFSVVSFMFESIVLVKINNDFLFGFGIVVTLAVLVTSGEEKVIDCLFVSSLDSSSS